MDALEHRMQTVENELIRQNKIHTEELLVINKHLTEITSHFRESYASDKVLNSIIESQNVQIEELQKQTKAIENDLNTKTWAVLIMIIGLLLSEVFHLI